LPSGIFISDAGCFLSASENYKKNIN